MKKLQEGRGWTLYGNSQEKRLLAAEIELMKPYMDMCAEIQRNSPEPVVFAPMFWVRQEPQPNA